MSSGGQKFIELLKKIEYPNANKLDTATFDWMFDEEDLKPLLETLCLGVTEGNILTPEEISKYENLVSENILHSPFKKKMPQQRRVLTERPSEEIYYLEADVASMEKCIKMLEGQKNVLSLQKISLVQQLEKIEDSHKDQQLIIQKMSNIQLPQLMDEMHVAIQHAVKVVEELNAFFNNISHLEGSSKMFFQIDIKPYIKAEERVLKSVECFLSSCQQLILHRDSQNIDEIFDCYLSGPSSNQLQNQLQLLQKTLQISEENYVKAILDVAKHENRIKFCKDLIEKSIYDKSSMQLRAHLEQVQQRSLLNEMNAQQLIFEVSEVAADMAQKQCYYVSTLIRMDKIEQFKKYQEMLQKPLGVLSSQQARLEFLHLCVAFEQNDLKDHLSHVNAFKQQIEAEVQVIRQFTSLCEESEEIEPANADCIQEGSVLHAANNILDDGSQAPVVFVSTADVEHNLKKLKIEKENLVRESEAILKQQLNWIAIMMDSVTALENHVHGKNFDIEHPSYKLERLKTNLTKLGIQVQHFEGKLLKEMKKYERMQKVFSQNSNIGKARKLFVYALTNQAKFESCLKELQQQVTSCNDS